MQINYTYLSVIVETEIPLGIVGRVNAQWRMTDRTHIYYIYAQQYDEYS